MGQPMNRETKRMLRKQGQLGEDDQPVARRRERAKPQPQGSGSSERVGPFEFLREVRGELRKVAWPSREEVINYSVIVFIAVILLTFFIFTLDFIFGDAVLKLLRVDS
jgi:preprotein translocase subunit SecE